MKLLVAKKNGLRHRNTLTGVTGFPLQRFQLTGDSQKKKKQSNSTRGGPKKEFKSPWVKIKIVPPVNINQSIGFDPQPNGSGLSHGLSHDSRTQEPDALGRGQARGLEPKPRVRVGWAGVGGGWAESGVGWAGGGGVEDG